MAATSSTLIHHRSSEEDPSLVYLNVYGVNNPFLRWLGLGPTVSCVQVLGHEYMFWEQGGVMESCLMTDRTRYPVLGRLRHSILIGRTRLDEARVHETVQQLRNIYTAASYDLFTNNCHHFSDRLCRRLTGGNPIPWWVNRIGMFGIFCPCLLPGDDDGHEPNSADHQERINADDDHGDDDEEHYDDGNHDTDDDDDDDEPRYWEILRREMRAMSRPASTKQEEDEEEAAPSGAPAADGAVPSNGSSESSEALFDRAASSIFCSGGSAGEQARIRSSFSI